MLFKDFWGLKIHQHYVIQFQHLLRLSRCGRILQFIIQSGRLLFNQVLTNWRTIKNNLQMFIFLQWVSFYSFYSYIFFSLKFDFQLAIDPENKLSYLRNQSLTEFEEAKKTFLRAVCFNLILTIYSTK